MKWTMHGAIRTTRIDRVCRTEVQIGAQSSCLKQELLDVLLEVLSVASGDDDLERLEEAASECTATCGPSLSNAA